MSTNISTESLQSIVSKLGVALAGRKPSGLDEYYSKIVFDGTKCYSSTHEVGIAVGLATDFTGAVDGRSFSAVVNSLRGEETTLEHSVENDVERIIIVSDGAKADLPLAALDTTSVLPSRSGDAWEDNTLAITDDSVRSIKEIFGRTLATVSSDDTRDWVRCLHFHEEEGSLVVYSSNVVQISRAADSGKTIDKALVAALDGMLINGFFCRTLLSFLEESESEIEGISIQFAITDEFVAARVVTQAGLFTVEAGLIDTKSVPPGGLRSVWGGFFDSEQVGERITIPAKFEGVIEQARILIYDKADPFADLVVDDNTLRVYSGNKEVKGTMVSSRLPLKYPTTSLRIPPDRVVAQLALGVNEFSLHEKSMGFYAESNGCNSACLMTTVW